jgi:hypothetical protein
MKGQAMVIICLTNLEDRHQEGQGGQVVHHLRNNPHSSTRSIQSSRDQRSYE